MLRALLLAALLSAAALTAHRLVHGGRTGPTPLAAYYATWTASAALAVWNPLEFVPVGRDTWDAALLAAGAVTAGYALALVATRRAGRARGAVSADVLRRIVHLLLLLGVPLFALFVPVLLSLGLVDSPATALYRLRVGLAEGGAPSPGFYFFYCFQPLVPASALLFRVTRQKRYAVIAAAAAACLLLTSGRTNATIAILWTAAALALARPPGTRRRRDTGAIVAAGVLTLVVFAVLGAAVGKTYENSHLAQRYGESPPVSRHLVLPVYYVTGPLPTLDQVMQTQGGADSYRNTLRPLLQVAEAAGAPVEAPPKIQPFYAVPGPFNLATYLSPLWRDGGLFGIALGAFLLGCTVGSAYGLWSTRRTAPTLLLAALATTTSLATALDASYNELSVYFQVACIAAAALVVRSPGSRQGSRPPPAHSGQAGPDDGRLIASPVGRPTAWRG